MNSTITELVLWFEQEKANPDMLMPDDPTLLEDAVRQLAGMRILLEKEENPALRGEYTMMYKALTDLLMFRIEKFCRGEA